MLSWVLVVFIAAIYQVFLVNQAVFNSIAAVHQHVFSLAFERNCAEAELRCTYTRDAGGPEGGAGVIWTPHDVPEVQIPVVGMFREGLPRGFRISSNAAAYDAACPDLPCKRTKVGSGTYKHPLRALWDLVTVGASGAFWETYLRRTIEQLPQVEGVLRRLRNL